MEKDHRDYILCRCGIKYIVPSTGKMEIHCPCGATFDRELASPRMFEHYTITFPEFIGPFPRLDTVLDLRKAISDIPDEARFDSIIVDDFHKTIEMMFVTDEKRDKERRIK